MSKATKRKHVTREVENEFQLPQEGQSIVKVLAGRGNNLHEVKDAEGTSFLVSMPVKFRKNVWIKRGDFVIVTHIEEGDKVKAEIATILYKDQIRFIKSENQWPKGFENQDIENDLDKLTLSDKKETTGESEDDSEEEDDSDLFQNTNRPNYQISESEDSDSETEDSESDED